MRLIDADALIADCQLAQNQADRYDKEFANAFYSGGGEISTEWWCVEDMIENAPTIEPERKRGEWLMKWNSFFHRELPACSECGSGAAFKTKFCPCCGIEMKNAYKENAE